MKTSEDPVIVEQSFNTTVDKVWRAITNRDEMIQWFFPNIETFSPEVGFETQFEVNVEDRTFTHLWKLTEVVPFKSIKYNWRYQEYAGNSFVNFELFEENGGVNLKLTHSVIEDFESGIPEFNRDSCVGGWNYFINQNLTKYLEE